MTAWPAFTESRCNENGPPRSGPRRIGRNSRSGFGRGEHGPKNPDWIKRTPEAAPTPSCPIQTVCSVRNSHSTLDHLLSLVDIAQRLALASHAMQFAPAGSFQRDTENYFLPNPEIQKFISNFGANLPSLVKISVNALCMRNIWHGNLTKILLPISYQALSVPPWHGK